MFAWYNRTQLGSDAFYNENEHEIITAGNHTTCIPNFWSYQLMLFHVNYMFFILSKMQVSPWISQLCSQIVCEGNDVVYCWNNHFSCHAYFGRIGHCVTESFHPRSEWRWFAVFTTALLFANSCPTQLHMGEKRTTSFGCTPYQEANANYALRRKKILRFLAKLGSQPHLL